MEFQENVVLKTILRYRKAKYLLKGLSVTRLEILGFALDFSLKNNLFFTVKDLHEYYPHTNRQQLRACLDGLTKEYLIQRFSVGVKNDPACYAITSSGKQLIRKYSEIVLNGSIDGIN